MACVKRSSQTVLLKLSKIVIINVTVVTKKMRDAEMELVFLSKITLMTVSKFKPISDRIAIMKTRGKYNNLVIIQAYAPTSKYADEDIENFHCELQNFINCM